MSKPNNSKKRIKKRKMTVSYFTTKKKARRYIKHFLHTFIINHRENAGLTQSMSRAFQILRK